MTKVLTVPDTTPAFSVSPTFGTTEVQCTPATASGGGGAPLSNVRFVNQGTTVPVPDQDGSATAPFSTIAAGITALHAAFPPGGGGTPTLLITPADYRAEGALTPINVSLIGWGNLSENVQVGTLSFGLELVSMSFVSCDSVTATGTVVCVSCEFIGGFSGGGGLELLDSTFNGNFNSAGGEFFCEDSSVGNGTFTCGSLTLKNSFIVNVTDVIGATVSLQGGLSAWSWHHASPAIDLSGGATLTDVEVDCATAFLQITVPALASGALGYATVDTTGTELDGIDVNDVVVANAHSDLAAAGAGNGGLINARVSALNTIRCAFVGALAGGGTSFAFSRVGLSVPPPT